MPTSSPTTIQALALAAHSAAIARTGGLRAAALRAYDAARIPADRAYEESAAATAAAAATLSAEDWDRAAAAAAVAYADATAAARAAYDAALGEADRADDAAAGAYALALALEGEHPEVIATVRALAQLDRAASGRTVSRRIRAALAAGASADLVRLATGGPPK